LNDYGDEEETEPERALVDITPEVV